MLYSIIAQGWSALAGPLTILVIAHRFSPVEQGFYYTFGSVLSLQVFVELGLLIVIVQVASHEWAFLQRDVAGQIHGDARALSRLASLLRFALKWFVVGGALVIGGLSAGGYLFFSSQPYQEVAWQSPWFTLCLVAGLALMMSPILSLIEGCDQVESIYWFRFVQGILNSLAVIAGVCAGMGLYALAVGALVRLVCGLLFIGWKHRRFVRQLLTCHISEHISWRTEVWPFQWRIGLSWIAGYFIFSIFTPVMFHYHGAKVAGQWGMSWTMVVAVESVAYAWINTRMPQFGMFIARRQFAELDHLFERLLWISMGMALICSLGVFLLVYGLQVSGLPLSARVLPLVPLGLLLGQRVINVANAAMTYYLRAHKQEPMMIPSIISAVLIGLLTWILGRQYGPVGAAGGFLIVTLLWNLPSCYFVFQRSRAEWHKPLPNDIVVPNAT